MLRVTLKRPWRSPRGKLYPVGSEFKKIRSSRVNSPGRDGSWYDFKIPGISYGFVFFSDSVHRFLTEEDLKMNLIREKKKREHLRNVYAERPFPEEPDLCQHKLEPPEGPPDCSDCGRPMEEGHHGCSCD